MSTFAGLSQSNSSDYYEEDDSQFLEALGNTVLPGDLPQEFNEDQVEEQSSADDCDERHPIQVPLKRSWSDAQQEQINSTGTTLEVEDDTYRASHFGGFGDYMRKKRAKLQIQNTEMAEDSSNGKEHIFKGLAIYVSCRGS